MSSKPILIAELSSNHMGDLDLAADMIDSAANSGADVVKFQTWRVDNLKPGPWDTDGRREIYEKAELSANDHFLLKNICHELNVEFLTSCFSINDIDFIRSLSSSVKIPGIECRNVALVQECIDKFDTVYISTGATTQDEYLQWTKYDNVWLMHCVSTYPCPSNQVNMHRMMDIAAETNRFGYSGHYDGIWDAIYALSLGALVVEKHFTIDKTLPFRDNKFAVLPEDMKQISRYRDEVLFMSEDKGVDFQTCEKENRKVYSGRWAK